MSIEERKLLPCTYDSLMKLHNTNMFWKSLLTTILERLGENHDDVAILKLTLPGNIISYPSLPSRGYHGAGRGLVY